MQNTEFHSHSLLTVMSTIFHRTMEEQTVVWTTVDVKESKIDITCHNSVVHAVLRTQGLFLTF